MKTMRIVRWGILAVLLALFWGGCGNTKGSSTSGVGSTASTVGGTSVTGDFVKVDLTTNRTQIAKGDVALVTATITCARLSGNCPVTDSNGIPIFMATPVTASDASAGNPVTITANYSVSAPGTIGANTQSLTLAAGTPAVAATSTTPATPAKLGASASVVTFSIPVTGVAPGAAILTVQSFTTTATIVVNVSGTPLPCLPTNLTCTGPFA